MKPEIDEIISLGIKKPSCSDLLVDENNLMVELEKPSTLFKVAQGPDGRYLDYFVSVNLSLPLKFPSRSASPVFLEHRKQPESGIEEIAFFYYDPQGRTKFYHVDDLQSKPSF